MYDNVGAPSACRNIRVISKTETNVSLAWDSPTTVGRSDFYYSVWYSDPDNIREFIAVNEYLVDDGAVVAFEVSSGLMPFTSYIFKVNTHNGVSDQDPDTHLRLCEVSTTTLQGSKL